MGDPCKNRVRAGIGGWPGTATGGQIHVVHISHTHPPKEIIQALRKYLLGKKHVYKLKLDAKFLEMSFVKSREMCIKIFSRNDEYDEIINSSFFSRDPFFWRNLPSKNQV